MFALQILKLNYMNKRQKLKDFAREFGIDEILLENLGREGYVRVTEIAKRYNKRFVDWLENKSTQEFIKAKIDYHNNKTKKLMTRSLTEILESIETKDDIPNLAHCNNESKDDLNVPNSAYLKYDDNYRFIPVSSLNINITIHTL